MADVATTSTAASVPWYRSRVSWGAIIAAVAIIVVLQVLITLPGLAIGLSFADGEGAGAVGIGIGIWSGIAHLLALLAGGVVAGRLAGSSKRFEAGLHGLAAWAVSILLMASLLSGLAGGLMSFMPGAWTQDVAGVQGQDGIYGTPRQQPADQPPDQQQRWGQAAAMGASAAWWSFVVLLVGAVLAGLGALLAAPKPETYAEGRGTVVKTSPPRT